MYLELINNIKDIKKLKLNELELLSNEIRELILRRVSKIGGHLGPNLGDIELTIALHYVFDLDYDKLVFDVTHQTYTHKILTNRKDGFIDEEDYFKYAGFGSPEESKYDLFKTGHTSSSISLGLGLVKARDLNNDKFNVISVIGDGSLSGGQAFEGLNNAGCLKSNFLIIINDNEMSIAPNQGSLYENLKELRKSNGRSKKNFFKTLGFEYVYIEKGNDIYTLVKSFKHLKDTNSPLIVHIHTIKGNGYEKAINSKEKFHFTQPFDIESGEHTMKNSLNYNDITYEYLSKKMEIDPTMCVVTSATPHVGGFFYYRRQKTNQYIDVGIAEQHMISYISGISKGNSRVFCPIHASFMQRAYDQISQDLALNNSNTTLLVFFGGLFGMKDATHLGIFDIPFLTNIPNLIYLDPFSKEEYVAMLEYSYNNNKNPIAIRVPAKVRENKSDININDKYIFSSKIEIEGNDVLIISISNLFELAIEIKNELFSYGITPTIIRPINLNDIDKETLFKLKENHKLVVTLEDSILSGGYGEKVASFYSQFGLYVLNYGLKKEFIDRFNEVDIMKLNRLDSKMIVFDILEKIGK